MRGDGERTLEADLTSVCFLSLTRSWPGSDGSACLNTQSLIYRPWIKLKLEALHTLFLEDLLARPLEKSEKPGGLWDREGGTRVVFEIDGTREAALQSLLHIPS
jgi:hypothetical protein